MYRIWKSGTLYFGYSQSPYLYRLPPVIQAELRQIVRKALESAERDVFKELDKFLKPAGIPSKDRGPMWAGLWQLIFIFRDLTRFFAEVSYMYRGQGGMSPAGMFIFSIFCVVLFNGMDGKDLQETGNDSALPVGMPADLGC